MQQFYMTLGGLALAVVAVILVLYVIKLYRKPKASKSVAKTEREETKPQTEVVIPLYDPIEALIWDNSSRRVYTKTLDGVVATTIAQVYGNLGGQRNYNGKDYYEYVRVNETDYRPYDLYLTPDRSHPPSELNSYVHQPEIAISRDVTPKQGFMDKYKNYLFFCFGIAFIIFMMVSSKGS